MKNLIILLVILPIFCFGQSVPGCGSYVASAPITATSNSTISGVSIDCSGAATVGINIPAGVHDVHITKCKIMNSKTSRGLIFISSGCYNITIDTCFLQSGWRGINVVGATNNIHIWNNYFYNIIDPNVTATSSDGGGSSVQLNNCNGASIQVLDNKSYHDVSGAGVGDQFSVYGCNGTIASPIRVCRNQALNGSNNPPSTGYAGAVGGDSGGSYQRLDSNIFVNVGAIGAQIQGGHDIEMSYNTIYLAQAAYTSGGMSFGNYSGVTSYNITMANNIARCTQPMGAIHDYGFDTSTAFQPAGWSTNINSTTLTASILPSPLLPTCAVPIRAPNISFSPNTYSLTKSLSIVAFAPNNSGSAAIYTATLPTGLTIDPGTGNISGTPTVLTAPTVYTVTATNTAGTSTTTLTIAIVPDATLSKMTISSGSVSPGFNNLVSNYTATVDNTITSITLTPTVNQASSTVTVNGTKVTSGSASGAINLAVGSNTITVAGTASDGVTTKTYTLIVTRAAVSATLSALVLSNGTLSPAFNSNTTSYTANVANTVTSITVTPTVKQANSTVTVNGTKVASGSASGAINLVAGTNVITTVVTASDGVTTKTYTVTVTRAASTDATLSSLAISNGTLAPVFASGTTAYTASVNNAVTSVTLTPTVNQANATAWVNGIAVPSGSPSGAINLVVGTNTITTIVIAQDGVTSITYTVTITRAVATDALLSSFTISNGTLAPVFDSGTTSYIASVDNSITSVTLTPILKQDSIATITVNGSPVNSGNASNPINLAVGVNIISTVVTAPDGTTIYTVTVTRPPSTDATLSSLVPSGGTLTPAFDSNITSYKDSVDNTFTSITLAPTVNQANATVIVNGTPVAPGNASVPVNLAVGDNTISTAVTAQDGATNKTYTITVTRALAANTITFNTLDNATYGDSPITLSATGNNTDSGVKITYKSDNSAVATVSGSTITIVGSGTANITASEAASTNFNAAPDVIQPLTVNKANLSITANDQSKVYGSSFTFNGTEFTTSGLLKNDAVNTLTLSSGGTDPTANSGSYPIIASDAAGNGLANYNISYQAGTLIVSDLNLTFAALPSPVYGAADFSPGATSNATVTYNSSNANVATIVSGNIHIVGAGTSIITSTADSLSQTQTLTVTPAPLMITAKDVNKTYGATLTDGSSSNGFSISGLQNYETIGSVNFAYGSGASANAGVATYSGSVIPSAATGDTFNAANYSIAYTPANIIVGQASLTITADNQSKAAGTTNPALTVSYEGFVSGDTPSSLNTPPTVTTTANTNSLAGGYAITASGAVDSNYNISYVQGTLTVSGLALSFGPIPSKVYGATDFDPGAASSSAITYTSSDTTVAIIASGNVHIVGVGNSTITANDGLNSINQTLTVIPATLNIISDNQTKTYGLANPDLTIRYNGFVNGDSQASLTSLPIGSTSASLLSSVGSYPITASGAACPNYNIIYTDGTLSVTPAPLVITADNQTKSQGSPNPSLTISFKGYMNGETVNDLTTPPVASTMAIDNSPVGSYPITPSGASDPNYAITYVQGTLNITGVALTFNPISPQTYGATDFSPGASSTSPTSYTSSNGAVATIVSGNIHIVGGGSTIITANNGSTSLQQTLIVTPIPLTITANSQSKTYGAVNPALTLGYSPFVNGDTPSTLATQPSVSTTAVTGSNVGTYPITVGGAADSRYAISYVAGTMTVTPTALTVTANNLSKAQGSANPTLTVGYAGFMNGDTQANLATQPVITTTAVTNSPIGTYPITAVGAAGSNYSISYVAGTLTVTAATLTFASIPSKVYGIADFSPGASSTAGAITYTSSNTAVATIVSGNIHIMGAGTSIITATNSNSSLQQTLTVTPAALTITANSVNKVYGNTLTNGSGSTAFTSTGLVSGQTIGGVTMAYSTGSAATDAVGTYSGSITPSAATGGTFNTSNYTITYNSNSIVVGRATLKITANNVNKTYGTTITGSSGSTAFTSTGLANGQTIGSITIAYGNGASATTGAGSYSGSVTPSAATGGTFTSGNYTISYTTGNITVNKAALTITANNQTKAQGAANPTLTVSYSGFVNSQTNSVLTTQPSVATTATTSSPAGTYPITASGAAAANYNISYVAGTLTVTGNSLTFGPIPSKVYGTANFSPGATGSGTITYTSSNTTVATIVSNNIHIVGVGTSTITASAGTNKLTQTLTVTRATLTITANNVNKSYGNTLTNGSGLTAFTSTGLVNGQTIGSVTMAYGNGAAATAALNTYTGVITPSAATGGTLTAANYTINYVKGNIVVVKAALKITANNVTKTYGTTISGGTGSKAFTATGLANGQTLGTVTIAYGTGASATTNAGTYTSSVTPSSVTGGTFVSADYTITYVSGNITVSQAALKITANNQTKLQGRSNPTLTVSYSGFVNGQTNSNLSTQPKVTTTATTSSPVGKYPITASGAVGANYAITYVAGTLTVNPQTTALISVNRPTFASVNDSDKLDVTPMEPIVKQAVSPNGDGINDVLTIENIEQYPDNKVMLMNRNGTTIFEMTGYNNMNKVFDGHSNISRAMQQPGTYFYMVEYKVKDETRHKTGYFIIKY